MPKKPPNLQETKLVKSNKKGVYKEKKENIHECGCGKTFRSTKSYWYHGKEAVK